MKKIIKLTENDLVRLVKKILKEELDSEKDCYDGLSNFLQGEGFRNIPIREIGWGDGEISELRMRFMKPPGQRFSYVTITLQKNDMEKGNLSFIIETQPAMNNDKFEEIDPKIKSLLNRLQGYKKTPMDNSLVASMGFGPNCESVKKHYSSVIVPLLEQLKNLGYKKI